MQASGKIFSKTLIRWSDEILITFTASPNKISIDNSSKKSLSNDNIDEVSHEINKENGEDGGYSVKSKLQRLGKLYSGN